MTSGWGGPREPSLRQQWRSERRAVLLAHHPDRGGDPDRMQDELERVDRAYADRGTGAAAQVALRPPGPWQPLSRGVRRARGVVRRSTRVARARLPVGWPGHRRYLDL
ncbi:MAG: hypothetical protein JWR42_1451 [Marmoricola sp.]|nr:hypothetical protein [Marmoricola sp.]